MNYNLYQGDHPMKPTDVPAALHTIDRRMAEVVAGADATQAGRQRMQDGFWAFIKDMTTLVVTVARERDNLIAARAQPSPGFAVVVKPILAPDGVLVDMTSDDLETIMRLAQAELDKRCRVASGKVCG